jgi:hypothetical protein
VKRSGPPVRKTPLRRKTPLKPKSKTARRKDSSRRCCYVTARANGATSRCTKEGTVVVGALAGFPDEIERYCRGHGTQIADAEVKLFVLARDRHRCQLGSVNGKPCSGRDLFACHLLRKGTYHATRWTPGNVVAGCAGHHVFFDNHQAEWLDFCVARLGLEGFEGLLGFARAGNGPDAAYVIRAFRAESSTNPAGLPDSSEISG